MICKAAILPREILLCGLCPFWFRTSPAKKDSDDAKQRGCSWRKTCCVTPFWTFLKHSEKHPFIIYAWKDETFKSSKLYTWAMTTIFIYSLSNFWPLKHSPAFFWNALQQKVYLPQSANLKVGDILLYRGYHPIYTCCMAVSHVPKNRVINSTARSIYFWWILHMHVGGPSWNLPDSANFGSPMIYFSMKPTDFSIHSMKNLKWFFSSLQLATASCWASSISLHFASFDSTIRSCHQSGARKQGLESCVLKLTIRLLPDRGWRCLGRVLAFCINMYAIVWFEACHQPRFVGYETNCKAVSQRIDGSFYIEIAPKEFLECHEQIFVAAWHQGFVDFKSHWMGRGVSKFESLDGWGTVTRASSSSLSSCSSSLRKAAVMSHTKRYTTRHINAAFCVHVTS